MLSTSLSGFIVAALIVLLIPGPGVLYVIARSLSQGQKAGLISVLGLAAGALVHVAAATAGLSAILLTSATAFGIIKLLGAAYLIYLGIYTLFSRHSTAEIDMASSRSMFRLFKDGVLISVLNPKIAIFFLAFLPQFVEPGQASIQIQILFLGVLYVFLAILSDGTYALLADRLRSWFGNRMRESVVPRYTSGVVYLGLGVSTALSEPN